MCAVVAVAALFETWRGMLPHEALDAAQAAFREMEWAARFALGPEGEGVGVCADMALVRMVIMQEFLE